LSRSTSTAEKGKRDRSAQDESIRGVNAAGDGETVVAAQEDDDKQGTDEDDTQAGRPWRKSEGVEDLVGRGEEGVDTTRIAASALPMPSAVVSHLLNV